MSDKPVVEIDESTRADIAKWAEAEVGKAKVRSAIHGFTDMCFKKCVSDANSNGLDAGEASCMKNCVNRFLDTNVSIVEMVTGRAQ